MKYMNRIEMEEFTEKYFPQYKGDIRKISYIVYVDVVEYLINDGILFKIML